MRNLLLFVAALSACTTSGSATTDGGGGGGPDGTVTGDGGGGTTTTAVSIIVEPNGNNGDELVSAIAAAQSSVYVTMYTMSSSAVYDALIARKQAGLDVQVILDGSSQNRSFNTTAYTKLKNAGIPVIYSSSAFTYTHEKTVMIDGKTAWIMTMNANSSTPSSNREYLAIDTDPADVAEAIAVFKADHALQPITPSGKLVVANANARAKLTALINSATTTLDVEGEELTDTNGGGIVQSIAAAAQRGVKVHVVVGNSSPDSIAIGLAKSGGAKVVVTGPTSGNGTSSNPYIHAKAIMVDCTASGCASGYIGSENFSAGSLGYNRELGVIFSNPTELLKVKTAIDTDFAKGTPQ